jgi:hypothetical protein
MQQRVCSMATYVREEEASKEEDEIFTEVPLVRYLYSLMILTPFCSVPVALVL